LPAALLKDAFAATADFSIFTKPLKGVLKNMIDLLTMLLFHPWFHTALIALACWPSILRAADALLDGLNAYFNL